MIFQHTKIGGTLGPACADLTTIGSMIRAGMSFARLNFSHGTYDEHAKLIAAIRAVEAKIGARVAVVQDLQGPKMRLGTLPETGVIIAAGDSVIFDTAASDYARLGAARAGAAIPISYPGLAGCLKPGERILIDDGRVEVMITAVAGAEITTQVVEGGKLTAHKGLNFPDSTMLAIPALSVKDQADVKFGVQMGVEFISLSFAKRAQDILDLRFLIEKYERELHLKRAKRAPPIRLIAKIERREAVRNIEEMIDAADGIMIARGDLGLELPAAELPLMQKKIIDLANRAAKPVIVATQMLDSMQHARRPTRAEVTDVANAVIDHADALLLTNETATGEHPVLVVETMRDIILATEKSAYDDVAPPAVHKGVSTEVAITELARILAEEIKAKLILAASISGETGRLISHVRPALPILVATSTDRVCRQLNLSWGVTGFILPECGSIEELVARSVNYIKRHKLAKAGDKMIIVAGEPVGQAGNVNLVEVREIK